MAIKLFWDDDRQTTLQLCIDGEWSLDEFNHRMVEANDIIEANSKPCIPLIINLEHAGSPPDNFIASLNQVAASKYINLFIIAGAGHFGQIIVQAVQRIYLSEASTKLKSAATLDEARQIILENHESA